MAAGLGPPVGAVALMASRHHYVGLSRRYDTPVIRRVTAKRRRRAVLDVKTITRRAVTADLSRAKAGRRRLGQPNRLMMMRSQPRWPRGSGRRSGRWR